MTKKNKLDEILSALPDAKNKRPAWTLEEDAALLKYADSKGVKAIARAIDKTPDSAYARLRELRKQVK